MSATGKPWVNRSRFRFSPESIAIDVHNVGENVVRVPGKAVAQFRAGVAQALDLRAEVCSDLIDLHRGSE